MAVGIAERGILAILGFELGLLHAIAAIFKTVNGQRVVSLGQLINAEVQEIGRIRIRRIPDIAADTVLSHAVQENSAAAAEIGRGAEPPWLGGGHIKIDAGFPGEIASAAE